MRLRPQPAQWFETYVPRAQTVNALEVLAETGVVQLECDPEHANPLDLQAVHRLIGRVQLLRDRYTDLLPVPATRSRELPAEPERTARMALDCLEAWSAPLEMLLKQQAELETAQKNLLLLQEYITAARQAQEDHVTFSGQSEILYKGLFACPQARELAPDICARINDFIPGREHNFFIIVDEPSCQDLIEKTYHSTDCTHLTVPAWLTSEPEKQESRIQARVAEIEAESREILRMLEAKKSDPGAGAALADIDLLEWYLKHSTHLAAAGKLCHVTGWTTAESESLLQQAFERASVKGVIRIISPPAYAKIPVDMCNPSWVRPFGFITDMLGTPDSDEIDPSRLLPFVVPLLFGYMFPDVGHGMVLILVSALLYQRWPAGRFLIPCGFSAILFGFVFGEIFGLEHVLDPLWVSPLEHPLAVLLVPMLFGIGLMLLALIFEGVEMIWRGEARNWLFTQAALLVLYPAVILGFFVRESLWVAVLALLWFLVGQLLLHSSKRLAHMGMSLGLLLRNTFELALNTLSFLRVGAFALAHAALSAAALGIADVISNKVMYMVVLILGHILIVSLEGLVVFVQTTRLVLFEFFINFLRAEGRIFRPMTKAGQASDNRLP